MDKKLQGKPLTLSDAEISSRRSVSRLSLLARAGSALGVTAAAVVAGSTFAVAQTGCTDADVGANRYDPVGRGVRCGPSPGTAARQKAAREKAEREQRGQEQRAEEQRAKVRADERLLEEQRARLKAEQQLREAQQRLVEEQQRAKLQAQEQALREAQQRLAEEQAKHKLRADELLRRERGAPPPAPGRVEPRPGRVEPPNPGRAENRLASASVAETVAALVAEFTRLDGLAQEWTGRSSLEGTRLGPFGGLLTGAANAISDAVTAGEALSRTQYGDLQGVFNTFGESELEANKDKIDLATRQLEKEKENLPNWPCPDSTLAALLLPAQRQQYRDESRQLIPELEALQKNYDQRATDLRAKSADADRQSHRAFEASRFLEERFVPLGLANGYILTGSVEMARFVGMSLQFREIDGAFTSYATAAHNLAEHYAKQSRNARDCAGYLRRL